MSINAIYMGGYGIYVWSAFIFAFVCCLYLYLKTKRELHRQEQAFLNHVKDLPKAKVQIVQTQRVNKEILVTSSKYSN